MPHVRTRDEQLLHVWLPKPLHRALKVHAAVKGVTMRIVLINLIERFVTDKKKAA